MRTCWHLWETGRGGWRLFCCIGNVSQATPDELRPVTRQQSHKNWSKTRCYRAGLGGSASNLSHTIAPSWLQLTARKRRVASPWGRQAPGSACDRLLPPPGRVAEPQRRAALTLPQPRERRGERFYEHARHPAHVRRPANHLYGLVRGEGSAVVRYGEPLRGAAPGSEPNSGTTPPSPRSRRYGSPMRVDHGVTMTLRV